MATTLREAIDVELRGVSLRALRRASDELSAAYRATSTPGTHSLDDLQRLAYIVVRMPATYAAVAAVLREATRAISAEGIRSLLDLGAGPGTTLWAAADALPALERATLVDRDAALLALGTRLWTRHPRSPSIDVDWRAAYIEAGGALPDADVVTLSYVLGEVEPGDVEAIVEGAFEAARLAVVVIEPGTPRGYRSVIDARAMLIARGASVAAPCPHDRECPLTGADWCHFAARLERSRAHRQIKGAELSWEHEKYAFVVATRAPVQPAAARILRRPVVEKGRITLRLCARDGLEDVTITRRDTDVWRAARHARWGEGWK